MTPEQIPDILADRGVQQDVEAYIDEAMKYRLSARTWGELQEAVRALVRAAMRRGLSDGFRYGWTIANNRKKMRI